MAVSNTHMFRELMEIPDLIDKGWPHDKVQINSLPADLFDNDRVILTGMGSSYFLAEMWVEILKDAAWNAAMSSCQADDLSWKFPNISSRDLVVTLSQSGNSKETTQVIHWAKKKSAKVLGFINNPSSDQGDILDFVIKQGIGREKSPVSTKYIAYQIALFMRLARHLDRWGDEIDLNDLSNAIRSILSPENQERIRSIACNIKQRQFIVVGDQYENCAAQELALKIRETTGLPASPDCSGILLHGWVNSLSDWTCCIGLNLDPTTQDRIEQKGANFLSIGHWSVDIPVPQMDQYWSNLLYIIAGQLLVHYLSESLGIDTDNVSW